MKIINKKTTKELTKESKARKEKVKKEEKGAKRKLTAEKVPSKTAKTAVKKESRLQREKKEIKRSEEKQFRYFETIGRRKEAVARVRLFTQGEKKVLVNGKPYQDYFSILEDQQTAIASLDKMNSLDRFGIFIKVKGGGLHAQAEAVRHGLSRALLKFNPDFRKRLRKVGFLTRDSRTRERKKFGLKRARRAPQWRKR